MIPDSDADANFSSAPTSASADQSIYKDPSRPIEERVEDLLGRMTVREKLGQLLQVFMKFAEEDREECLQRAREGMVGSRIITASAWGFMSRSLVRQEDLNELQRAAVEESRLGIPVIYGRDVIHGHRTVFPIPLGQAASWNPALVEEAMTVAAAEAAAEGLHWTFAPMMDVTRDPRWGRIIECYGEDPFLNARFAEASVRGFQGEDPSQPDRILACAKHFAAYGGAEGGRDYDTTEWSENTLHNVILPPFRASAEAGAASFMSGFNDLGGTPVSGSRGLMRDWLKTELGWDGFIVSDWGSVKQLIGHGVAADHKEAAEQALNAGVDMEMVTPCYADHLEALLEEGRVSREFFDDAVKRVLRGKFRAGLFERPYCDPENAEAAQRRPEAVETAVKLAEQSLVLLKNQDEILPLPREDCSIAFLGPYASAKRQCMGTWVLDGREDEVTSILEGVEAVAPDLHVITANPAFLDECIHAAVRADVVVLCLGESHERTGENQCITNLALPPGQEELIREIGKRGIPLVVVLCNGRPIPSPAAEQFADAIVQAWHGGTEMGTAVARVLFGESNFSGKLPVTIPRHTGQIPIYYNRKYPGKLMDMNPAQVAYKDESWEPLYPFGYGLSYTEFAYGNLRIDREKLAVEDLPVRVSVEVENLGEVAGEEVVQLYLQDPVASTARPVRELKGFQRIALEPGEKKTVSFELTHRHLEFYNAERRWAVEPGEFRVWIGGDSQAALGARFWVE